MDTAQVKAFLTNLPAFSEVDESAIDWLIEKSTCHFYEKGDYFLKAGQPTTDMIILLSGAMDAFIDTEEGRRELSSYSKGDISGNLPFSRAQTTRINCIFVENAHVLLLSQKYFVNLPKVSYNLTQALVGVMSDRIRSASQTVFQDEKLKALGRLSAGLAHELNNPTAAILRTAENLYQKIKETPQKFKEVMSLHVSAQQTDLVNQVLFDKIEQYQANKHQVRSVLQKEDLQDELLDWLEDKEIEEDCYLDTLVDFDFQVSDFDLILKYLDEEVQKVPTILKWFDDRLTIEMMVGDIREGSQRVSELVQSIKSYSYMDQGIGRSSISINNGIIDTLRILQHKTKEQSITVVQELDNDLPQIEANPGELNQVWTNLISNAIDAMPNGGHLVVRTYLRQQAIMVQIEDNGVGIPADIQTRIWEPFFTTKDMGIGTGIGLDIVKKIIRRHRGDISLESEHGKTIFCVKLYVS